MLKPNRYTNNVFLNCPFDAQYQPLFQAMFFAVTDCGFRARCSLEIEDSSEVRMEKIMRIIGESRYGIHDLSRTELSSSNQLPHLCRSLQLEEQELTYADFANIVSIWLGKNS